MTKVPYHVLEAELHRLRDELAKARAEATRDPCEYRRGYHVGYAAGRRRAASNPDVRRRVRSPR